MHQAPLVRGLQSATGLLQHVERVVGVDPALAGQDRGQRLTFDQFHHQVRGILRPIRDGGGLTVVVHRGDPRVVQRRGGPGLRAKPVQELRVTAQLRLEHLDGHGPVQPDVHRLPHLAHPTDGNAVAKPVPVGE